MPNILIIAQVFPPEHHPTAVMLNELAQHLASVGWNVTVVTGRPNHPYGEVYSGYKNRVIHKERMGEVDVHRTWHFIHPSRSIPVRALGYLTQAVSNAVMAGMFSGNAADLVLVCGMPFVGPNLGKLVALKHKVPIVNVIYDIYPDVAIETGKVTNPLVIRLARLLEQTQYRATDMTVVLSKGFKRTLTQRGVPPEKIAVVPLWLDEDKLKPLPRVNEWRSKNGIQDDTFVVLHAGTFGVISDSELVAQAAERLKASKDILFLFVGGGEQTDDLKRLVAERKLTNFKFLPFQPREDLGLVQAAADVSFVALAAGRGMTSVPSKVLGYMAAGRPVIAVVDRDSDTAIEIEEHGCGQVVPPSNAAGLADAILRFRDDEELRNKCGNAARKRFVAGYSKNKVLERYERLLRELAGRANPT